MHKFDQRCFNNWFFFVWFIFFNAYLNGWVFMGIFWVIIVLFFGKYGQYYNWDPV